MEFSVLLLPQAALTNLPGRELYSQTLQLGLSLFCSAEVGRPVSVLVEEQEAGHLSTQKVPYMLTRNSTSFLMALC